jgi:hypothetical protein
LPGDEYVAAQVVGMDTGSHLVMKLGYADMEIVQSGVTSNCWGTVVLDALVLAVEEDVEVVCRSGKHLETRNDEPHTNFGTGAEDLDM